MRAKQFSQSMQIVARNCVVKSSSDAGVEEPPVELDAASGEVFEKSCRLPRDGEIRAARGRAAFGAESDGRARHTGRVNGPEGRSIGRFASTIGSLDSAI